MKYNSDEAGSRVQHVKEPQLAWTLSHCGPFPCQQFVWQAVLLSFITPRLSQSLMSPGLELSGGCRCGGERGGDRGVEPLGIKLSPQG